MLRTVLTLTVAGLASSAFAQEAPSIGGDLGGPTCGSFVTQDSTGQIGMLATIQPMGDEIDPTDEAASWQWAQDVTKACGDHAEKPLAEAAREALGE